MYRVLPIERTRREPPGPYGACSGGQRRAPQPGEAAGAGAVSFEPGWRPWRLGHRGESAQGRGSGPLRHPEAGIVPTVSGGPAGCQCYTKRAGSDGASGHDRAAGGSAGLLKAFALALIGFYRSAISPAIPSSCRFYPTCSTYAYEAVSRWGLRRGLQMTLKRLGRCRPFGPYGYDPVPERSGGAPQPTRDSETEACS